MQLLHSNDAHGVHADSWYHASTDLYEFPQLSQSLDAEVCVIGAGFTGLSAALHLAQNGFSVVILDAHRVGWGASGRNGGQLGSGFNQSQIDLERSSGLQRAHDLWSLSEDAKQTIKDLCKRYSINIHYQPGIIHADHRSRFVGASHDLAHHMHRQYAYAALQTLNKHELQELVATDCYHGGVLDHGAGHIHPLKLAVGLARACSTEGVRVFELSEVIRIDKDARMPGTPEKFERVVTPQGSVRATHVVLACNGYLDNLEPAFAQRVMPINNFIVATEPLGELAQSLLPGKHAVADSRYVVNYFRLSHDNRLLFGGGENYSYRFPANIEGVVRRAMLGVFPQLGNVRITHSWGGTLAITRSRMPCVRRLSPHRIAAGGYSGHGVALSVITGKVIAEAVAGDARRFNWLAELPAKTFPGGHIGRSALLAMAMTGYSWLDRL